MRRPPDLREALAVYVITDEALAGNRGLASAVASALAGGAGCLQYRAKDRSIRPALAQGARLQRIVRESGALFIVNDRVDLALALGADGVHLGEEDMPVRTARRILGPRAVIGASVDAPEVARRAVADGADYLGVGPVFATGTKSDAGDPLGPAGLCAVAGGVDVPVVGIGGITVDNADRVVAAGAAGVAVVSAVMAAEDPAAAVRRLLDIVKAGGEIQ